MRSAEREFRDRESLLRALVAGQRDLVTVAQAKRLGFTSQSIGRRSVTGAWHRILPGVYLVGGQEPRFDQRALGALLWAGPGAALSHFTAARLLRLTERRVNEIELWVPPERRVRYPAVRLHRGAIAPNDRRMIAGLALTSPGRTLVDCAPRLDDEELEAMLEAIVHRGLSNEQAVARCVDRVGGTGRAGSGRLRCLLEERGNAPALESRLEVRIWRLLRSAGLRPVRQHKITYEAKTYRLDFAWPSLRVAIEGVGFSVHGRRQANERDNARLAALAARGWVIVPVTWRRVTEDAAGVLEDIVTALRSASAA